LPPTNNVENEKLEVVIEKTEKLKEDNILEKENIFAEGVSTVRFEINE
jgi:hypothetical protein